MNQMNYFYANACPIYIALYRHTLDMFNNSNSLGSVEW